MHSTIIYIELAISSLCNVMVWLYNYSDDDSLQAGSLVEHGN